MPTCIALIHTTYKKKYRAAQKMTKLAMITGLVALILTGFL